MRVQQCTVQEYVSPSVFLDEPIYSPEVRNEHQARQDTLRYLYVRLAKSFVEERDDKALIIAGCVIARHSRVTMFPNITKRDRAPLSYFTGERYKPPGVLYAMKPARKHTIT